jgi:hypothetical protein
LRTGAPQTVHSWTGSSENDCTTSNSCLPSGLLQTYWYVGTALALLVGLKAAIGLALSPDDCQ